MRNGGVGRWMEVWRQPGMESLREEGGRAPSETKRSTGSPCTSGDEGGAFDTNSGQEARRRSHACTAIVLVIVVVVMVSSQPTPLPSRKRMRPRQRPQANVRMHAPTHSCTHSHTAKEQSSTSTSQHRHRQQLQQHRCQSYLFSSLHDGTGSPVEECASIPEHTRMIL